MLSLPSKPWKKIKLAEQETGRFQITVVSPVKSQAAFERMITEELQPCLSAGDALTEPVWDTRSLVLTTSDIKSFKRKLVYACILIEKD